ncbi:MAG: GNAT family N-acetyltransferase [Candidatus Cloacimonetes bacterium]|nr:GNAT family N-acetyltransferase [Candidatus Cloacimonadota bacterium]
MITFGLDKEITFNQWARLFRLLPQDSRSPFFSPEYYLAYNAVEEAEIECFWAYLDADNFLFYPYLKKSINALGYELKDEFYDISGAYGYNGPIGNAEDTEFIKQFNIELQKHLIESKVVTEFVRYCPIAGNHRYHTYTQQFNVLDNVYISLANGLDWVWNESFEYRVRKSVRKGESYGLKTTISRGLEITGDDLHCFYNIYTSTMNRNDADGFYYFDYAFFQSMILNMGEMILLVLTYLGDKAISAELVLLEGKLAFGFLGGTLSDFYNYKANTFQRWELLKYLYSLGVEKYSMGGGASRNDSIYDFKMSFAKGCVNPFFIGTKVHLPDVYEEIKAQWAVKYPQSAERNSGKLQGYRIQN